MQEPQVLPVHTLVRECTHTLSDEGMCAHSEGTHAHRHSIEGMCTHTNGGMHAHKPYPILTVTETT